MQINWLVSIWEQHWRLMGQEYYWCSCYKFWSQIINVKLSPVPYLHFQVKSLDHLPDFFVFFYSFGI